MDVPLPNGEESLRVFVHSTEIRAPKLCQFRGASPPKIFGATVPHIFYSFGRPRGLVNVCQISAAGCTAFRRYGRRCVTTPSQKAVFARSQKVKNLTASSALIYTCGTAIPLPQNTAAVVGQILPWRFWIGRTPWELLPPQTFEFQRRGPISAPPGDCQ